MNKRCLDPKRVVQISERESCELPKIAWYLGQCYALSYSECPPNECCAWRCEVQDPGGDQEMDMTRFLCGWWSITQPRTEIDCHESCSHLRLVLPLTTHFKLSRSPCDVELWKRSSGWQILRLFHVERNLSSRFQQEVTILWAK